ncbi:MAG: NUDIX hydrolase [Roseibacillus sp.]
MGSIHKIAEGHYLGLYKRDDWEFAERPNADGVVGILAHTPQDEVVLVEQFRIPVQSRVIEIPAGLIGDEEEHQGESLEGTAQRELIEETGYRAGSMTPLFSGPTSAGMTPEITHFFLATDLQQESEGGGVGSEEILVHLVPRTNLRSWLAEREEDGFLIDFKIHAALWLAGLHDLP